MKFAELLSESKLFSDKETEQLTKYCVNNGGSLGVYQSGSFPEAKLLFTRGSERKILIRKGKNEQWNISLDSSEETFNDFKSVLEFLNDET
jgi:hypothetical protein